MLNLCEAKNGVFLLSLYPAQKEHVIFGVGTMLGAYGAYFGPMLIHVRLLEAMLGLYWSHVELMSSQERRVPLKTLPGPKGTRRFWIMSGPCWRIRGLCSAYVDPC